MLSPFGYTGRAILACAATGVSVAYLDVSEIGLPIQSTGLALPCGTSRRRELDED